MIIKAAECPVIEASKVFLEIGCAYHPVPANGDYTFDDDEQYIGVNIKRSGLEWAEEELDRAPKLALEPVLIHGDAQELPPQLGDGSVDTIYFGNVFGDPGIDAFHIAELKARRFREHLERSYSWKNENFDPHTKQEPISPRELITLPGMLREAHRVIKGSGRLVVVETISPFMDRHMDALLGDAGFTIDEHVHHEDETIQEWQTLVAPFKRFEARRPPESIMGIPPSSILFASKLALAEAA